MLSKVLKAARPRPPIKAVLVAEHVEPVRESIAAVVPSAFMKAVQHENEVATEHPLHGKSARKEVVESSVETSRSGNSNSNSSSSTSSSEDSSDVDSSSEESN